MTSAGCGPISHEPCATWDQVSSSWRTPPGLFEEEALRSSFETWPRAGGMRSGVCYPRAPLAPRTAESGSLWSRGEYPTPTATRYGSSQNEWAVPHDRPTRGTESLDTWARKWPAATASYAQGGPSPSQHADLRRAAARWPTPKARDHRSSGCEAEMRRNSPDLNATAAHWPTATAADSRGSRTKGYGGQRFMTLTDACQGFPQAPTTGEDGTECSTLVERISSLDLCPVLNPAFQLWLMGWLTPQELTCCDSAETE